MLTADEKIQNINADIEGLQEKASTLMDKMGATSDPQEIEGLKSQMSALTKSIEPLQQQAIETMREKEMEGMKSQLSTLGEALDTLKGEAGQFETFKGQVEDNSIYGPNGDRSFFKDIAGARKNDQKAWENLKDAKAMVESDDASGGFLVPEQTLGGLQPLRDQLSVVRGLVNVVQVSGDTVRFIQQTSGLLAGWTAELGEKPLSDMKFGEVEANIFTAAGMSVASNQLLADSKWSVDQLIFTDLAKRLNTVEEVAIISGSGEGQPLGILNTPGVDAAELTSNDPLDLLDAVVNAIAEVYTDHLMAPTAILMHPRVWAKIIKAREDSAPSTYLVGPGSSAWGRRANDPVPGLAASPSPVGQLFGVNVYCSANMPTDIEGNQSAVIVGDFSEGLILDRQGITTDTSEHVFFTTNQTIFRAEERMGFTAARDPKAFKVIGGSGVLA